MKFCPNCGKELPEGVKFCPYCGYKIVQDSNGIQESTARKMSKGVTKTLDFSDTVENSGSDVQPAKPTTRARHKKKQEPVIEDMQESLEAKVVESTGKYTLPNNAIVMYFIFNIILMISNTYNDEIVGIVIYTWIVLVIMYIRRNKEKPFNWLLNIFLTLQGVLVFAAGMMTIAYIDAGGDSVGAVVRLGLLVSLFISILVMLYQGNRRKQ